MKEIPRFRSTALVGCALAVILSGCTALRLQNDQRRKVADEAAALAEKLRASETDPFAAMEDGIDSVAKARKLANDYLDANRKEAFLAALPGITREELAEELMTALSDHQNARRLVASFAQDAAEGVKANLKRQAAIKGMEVPADSKIETVLATVKKRLDKVTEVQTNIGKAMSSLKGKDDKSKGKDNKSKEAAIQAAVTAGVTDAKEFINSVRTDSLVQESSRLLLQAGLDLAASETERLQEMRRHLEAMLAIQEGLTKRDQLYAGELLVPALGPVASDDLYWRALQLPVRKSQKFTKEYRAPDDSEPQLNWTEDPKEKKFKLQYSPVELNASTFDVWVDEEPYKGTVKLANEGSTSHLVFTERPLQEGEFLTIRVSYQTLLKVTQVANTPKDLQVLLDLKNDCWQREWAKDKEAKDEEANDGEANDEERTFGEFVKASFAAAAKPTETKNCEEEDQERWDIETGIFIASLGVILFDERTFDAQQAVAAGAELHLHSVRLSRINSRQRIDLVGQVTEALRIYYQGGVTPQQAAQMVLMAANVLATGAIATQL